MLRYITVFFLLTAGVYASTCDVEFPPTVTLVVNGVLYEGGGIVVEPGLRGAPCTHTISGEASGPGYRVTFTRGTVHEDPLVDFGLEFSSFDDGGQAELQALVTNNSLQTPVLNLVSDLQIDLFIRSNYSGGPFDFLNFLSNGLLIDNGGDGATLFGTQQFFLDGATSPEAGGFFGCFEAGGCNAGPPSNILGPLAPPLNIGGQTGFMELQLHFTLSGGDTFIVGGGTQLESTPEPATVSLIGIGLLSLAGLARRRRKA